MIALILKRGDIDKNKEIVYCRGSMRRSAKKEELRGTALKGRRYDKNPPRNRSFFKGLTPEEAYEKLWG
ncbi:MAG: hypothetical protein WC157_00815 [Candidatus Paceibacterota bacterium]